LFFNNLAIRHIESSGSQLSLFSLFSTISLLWTQFRASVDTTWTPRWTPNQVNATTQLSLSDTFYFGCPLNIAFVNLRNECRCRPRRHRNFSALWFKSCATSCCVLIFGRTKKLTTLSIAQLRLMASAPVRQKKCSSHAMVG